MASSRNIRKKWPCNAIADYYCLKVLGVDRVIDVTVCPYCKLNHVEVATPVTSNRDFNDSAVLTCEYPACARFYGTLFDYLLAVEQTTNGAQTTTASEHVSNVYAKLRQQGCRIPKSVDNPNNVLRYLKYRESLAAFREFGRQMSNRRVSNDPDGNAQHKHPYWWRTSRGELALHVGDGRLDKLGVKGADAVTAIPLYDKHGHIIGLKHVQRTENNHLGGKSVSISHYATNYVYGCSGGIGFYHALRCVGSADRSNIAYITGDYLTAIQWHQNYFRQNVTPLPLIYIPDIATLTTDVSEVVVNLPVRDWVVLEHGTGLAHWVLAKKINALVVPTYVEHMEFTLSSHQLSRYSKHWTAAFYDKFVNSDIGSWRLENALRVMGWPGEFRNAVVNVWPRDKVEMCDSLVGKSSERRITLKRNVTIVDTPKGWLWEEEGAIIVSAVPVVTKRYHTSNGVVHEGYIRWDKLIEQSIIHEYNKTTSVSNMIHVPFKTLRFRKDPVAVIETALLKAGMDVPAVHPAFTGSIAELALYFSGAHHNAR